MDELKSLLGDGCVDFSPDQAGDAFQEQVAMCDEALLNQFLDSGHVTEDALAAAIAKGAAIPLLLRLCPEAGRGVGVFGRAGTVHPGAGLPKILPRQGVQNFPRRTGHPPDLAQAHRRHPARSKPPSPATRTPRTPGRRRWTRYASTPAPNSPPLEQVTAGTVCAVTGLTHTLPGDGLGDEPDAEKPILEPVLTYQMLLPEGTDVYGAFLQLKTLMEEDPQLHLIWNQTLQEIHIQLMGEIQLEIMKRVIADRFGLEVRFSSGNILYKETIAAPVEGVGHFEPLRHYAEVHLLLEPLPRGSGLVFGSLCSQDVLDLNWQRLILTHLMEKEHIGVLTGSPITDMRISILAGRAHVKHTEGGDFRQATYRAVRHGLTPGAEHPAGALVRLPAGTAGTSMWDGPLRTSSRCPAPSRAPETGR